MGNKGNNGKNIIFALAGVYLAYLGGSLIMQSYREKPDQYVLFIVAGIGFLVCGLVILAGYLKAFFKHEEIKEVGEDEDESVEKEEDETSELLEETEIETNTETEEDVDDSKSEEAEDDSIQENPDNIVKFPGFVMEEVPLKDSAIEELTLEETKEKLAKKKED